MTPSIDIAEGRASRDLLRQIRLGIDERERRSTSLLSSEVEESRSSEKSNVESPRRLPVQRASPLFDDWYGQISQYTLLSFDEHQSLGRRIEAGQRAQELLNEDELGLSEGRDRLVTAVAEGRAAAEKMVLHNLRLVRSLAVRARGRSPSLDSDDVFQAGVVGLIHAAQKFDWRRGYTFATYATYWIRQAIQREWSNSAPQVHIPVHFFSYLDQPPRGDAEPTWTAKSEAIGRDGVPNAIAILNGLQSLDHLTAVQREDALRGASRVLGAGVSSDEEDVTFAEADSRIEQRDLVRLLKDGLDPRGFRILMLRFGFDSDDGWTLDEVGRSMGLTRERIRQIEKVALASSRVLLKGFEVQIE